MNILRLKLVVSLASIALTLGLLEGYARLVLKVTPRQEMLMLHPRMGWEWTPGYEGVEHIADVDYYFRVSRQGIPNAPTYAIPKPRGIFRILALGDSVTEAPGAAGQDSFVQRLQQQLQARYTDETIEVINGGTHDYNTQQELAWLEERGMRFEPDVVVLTVYMNDSRPTALPNPITAAAFNLLISRSAAYYYFTQRIRAVLLEREQARSDYRFRYKDEFKGGAWVHDEAALTQLIRDAGDDWGLAWTDTGLSELKSGLAEVAAFTRAHQLPLLINIAPAAVQVYAEADTPLKIDRPQTELVAFARSENIPALDLLPILREHRDEDLFLDQAHYRANGHAIVAQAILDALVTDNLIH